MDKLFVSMDTHIHEHVQAKMHMLNRAHTHTLTAYSVIVVSNPDLMEIDLSALEEIRGRGVIWAFNPQLCFAGDFGSYVSSDSGLTGIELECAAQNRRDPAACSK